MDTCRKVLFPAFGAFLIVLCAWIADSPAQETNKIRFISGSKYMYFSITDLAKYYEERHPDVTVTARHAEYYMLVQALAEKTADGIMSLGKLDDEIRQEALDQGIQLREQLVGWGGVVLVTDPQNSVNELTLEQVRKIFLEPVAKPAYIRKRANSRLI